MATITDWTLPSRDGWKIKGKSCVKIDYKYCWEIESHMFDKHLLTGDSDLLKATRFRDF